MKYRSGFVSNSSSSSFVIKLRKLTGEQIYHILRLPYTRELGYDDSWSIILDAQDGVIRFYCDMTTDFNMREVLNDIGIDDHDIRDGCQS